MKLCKKKYRAITKNGIKGVKKIYHKIDAKILQFELESIEFKFGMWITKKEFGQRLNDTNPLPKGQFYMSVRIVAKDIEVTEKIARRLIKQFTKLEIIRLISTSKSPKQGSIYEYVVQVEEDTKKGTVEDTVKTQLGHSKNEETSDFKEGKGHSKDTVEGTIEGTSKNKIKIKENNIYISKDILVPKDLEPIAQKWNSLNLSKINSIKNKRLKMLRARIRDYGMDNVLKAIDNISKSNFLQGQNNKNWTITFDWFIKPNNFDKVLDGNYNNKVVPNKSSFNSSYD